MMTHASAGTRTGARVSDRLVSDLLSLLGLSHLQVSAVGLEGGDNVERLLRSTIGSPSARSGLDRSSVDHETGAVEPAQRHQGTRHVLVAARDDDHPVEPMTTSSGLYRVGDEVSRLQRVGHWGKLGLVKSGPAQTHFLSCPC